jgi:lysophospholipid acyltransferase (LPLAT)-like uncharacterized protein
MRALRPIINHPKIRTALCSIVSQYIRFVHWSGDWKIVGDEQPAKHAEANEPFIMACWHGRLLMMPFCRRFHWHVSVLISGHRDGQMIAKTVQPFNVDTITGSTGKGGASALRGLAQTLKKGGVVGITPDGPRGPRMRASGGIVALARISGIPIYTISYSAKRGRVLGSWDRFLLPLPFTRGVFTWSGPIDVPKDADKAMLESKRLEVEEALNATGRQCDELMGRPATEPAPLPELADAAER